MLQRYPDFGYNETETTITLAGYLALSGSAATDNCNIATVTYQDSQFEQLPDRCHQDLANHR